MSRTIFRATVVAFGLIVLCAACSTDTKKSTTTDAGSAASSVSAADPTASSSDDTATPETATDETTSAVTATADTAGAASTVDGGAGQQNAAITELSSLDGDAVCALFPQAEVSTILGIDAGEPSGNSTPGLGSGCSYLVEGNDGTLISAQLTFASFDWATQEIGLTSGGDSAIHASEECTVGGKEALCAGPSKDGDADFPATVVVKLGSDADYTMETNGETLDQAKALAELALAKLAI